MNKRNVLFTAIGVVVLFLLIQLIPLNTTNPTPTREVKWDSPQTRLLVQRACFDCHSDETTWPWYAKIEPVAMYLANHVDEGRRRLNFSEWDQPNANINEVERSISEGNMPLWDYLLIHSSARLTDAETQQLLAGLQATYQNDPPIARPGGFDR